MKTRKGKRASPYFVEAVGKAIDIVWSFKGHPEGLSIDVIVQSTRLAKSTTYRLLSTLVEAGLLEIDAKKERYTLAPKLFQLAASTEPSLRLAAEPEMRRLWSEVKETISLGTVNDGEVVYLLKLSSPHPFRVDVPEGTRACIHATALGKAMAAFMAQPTVENILRQKPLKRQTPNTITTAQRFWSELKRTRERGYSMDNQEMVVGGRCLGSPLFNAKGDVVGALSISGPALRIGDPPGPQLIEALQRTGRAISAKLGFNGPDPG